MSSAETHFSELFRFTTVRNPQLHDPVALRKRFIILDVKDRVVLNRPDAASLLMTTIPAAGAPSNVAAIRAVVAAFETNGARRLRTSADVSKLIPLDFAPVEAWLRVTPKPTLANLIATLTTAAIVPATVVGQANFNDIYVTLWENLVAEYFIPTDAALREELVKRIRWFWILQRIVSVDADLVTEDDVRSASRATALIPSSMWTTPTSVAVPSNPPTRQRPTQSAAPAEPIGRKLTQYEGALAEIDEAYRQQNSQLRVRAKAQTLNIDAPRAPVTKLEGLSADTINGISADTKKTLGSLNLSVENDAVVTMRARISVELRRGYAQFAAARPITRSVYVGGGVAHLDEVCSHFTNPDPCAKPVRRLPVPTGRGQVSTMGVADLRVVRTDLLKYLPGEIAHIENILVGESKVHTFRTFKRDEVTDVSERETTTEEQRDSQTTDRFELSQESSKVIKDDLKVDAGVTLSANMGSVTLGTTANFAMSKSQETTNKLAVKQASEIVNKAMKRVIERRRAQRTTVSIIETDENDAHTLANAAGPENISGIYRWVDKYYLAKVLNYDTRLMLEFLVPEPAAFYWYRKTAKPPAEDAMVKPISPKIAGPTSTLNDPNTWVDLTSFDQITPDNVGAAAAPYDAAITAAPAPEITRGVAIKNPDAAAVPGDNLPPIPLSVEVNSALSVPEGYQSTWANVQVAAQMIFVKGQSKLDNFINGDNPPQLMAPMSARILVGTNNIDGNSPLLNYLSWPMNLETGIVPISVFISASHWVVNVEVQCERRSEHLVEWQIQAFSAINAGYQAKLKQYRDWLTQQETRAKASVADGTNPDSNRAVEREELKKSAIEILTNQHFDAFDAMVTDPATQYPQIDNDRAKLEGGYVQFFEQAFEWPNTTYLFYPYFWNEKPNWIYTTNREDADPLFTKFLQAGYARVVVPVRDSYRDAILHYLSSPTGEIWNGGDVPAPHDPLYVSILDEFKLANGDYSKAVVEDAFEVKMPTNLIMLQPIAQGLPDNSKALNWPPP